MKITTKWIYDVTLFVLVEKGELSIWKITSDDWIIS